MSWPAEAVNILRVMINDVDATPAYDDARLMKLITASAFQVNAEAGLAASYDVDVGELTITPDPSEDDSKDDNFVYLSCLKAACTLERAEASLAAKRGFSFRDGGTSVDFTKGADFRLKLLGQGWCKEYERARFLARMGGLQGAVVMTPFRAYYHNRRTSREGD